MQREVKNVSVVIPTKNPGLVFRNVMQMVLAQKTDFKFDVLVIDSGSTDGTINYIRAITDGRLRLHQIKPEEFGHGKTRNLGISMCKGEFVALITHDACPANDEWLQNFVNVIKQDKKIAGVFGRHIAYTNANPFTHRTIDSCFAQFEQIPLSYLDDPERYRVDIAYQQFLYFFSNNNALIRRSIWEKIPYPEVDFAEDQAWARKIIEAGFAKAYAKEAIVYHSHNYSFYERMQRSFDESYALYKLFGDGHRFCPNLKVLIREWIKFTYGDYRFIIRERLWKIKWSYFFYVTINNFMVWFGYYLGAKAWTLSKWGRDKLFVNRKLFFGQ